MPLSLSLQNSGVPLSDAEKLISKTAGIFDAPRVAPSGMNGWLTRPDKDTVKDIISYAETVRKNYRNFVLFGIGGSALGARAVHYAAQGAYYNEKARPDLNFERGTEWGSDGQQAEESRSGAYLKVRDRGERPHVARISPAMCPRLFIEDNADPRRLCALLDFIDLSETLFNVVSKSGGTTETAAQLAVIYEKLTAAKLPPDRHIVVTVGDEKSDLYKFAQDKKLKIFRIPENVGGRFSVFTPVGILPLAVCGVDVNALLEGAYSYAERAEKDRKNPSVIFAAALHILKEQGKNITVTMPYAEPLRYISDWFCQLWAESLGKSGSGATPLPALGTTDQHSLLQLFSDGPDDKVIVFIDTETSARDIEIKNVLPEYPVFASLAGKKLSDLQSAARGGVYSALAAKNRSAALITLPDLSPRSVGELLMFYMLAVPYAARFACVENPYDQPGVEEAKRLTKEYLKKG